MNADNYTEELAGALDRYNPEDDFAAERAQEKRDMLKEINRLATQVKAWERDYKFAVDLLTNRMNVMAAEKEMLKNQIRQLTKR